MNILRRLRGRKAEDSPHPVLIVSVPPIDRARCVICGKSFAMTEGRVLISSRVVESRASVMVSDEERAAAAVLARMGISVDPLASIASNVFVCHNCYVVRFSMAAHEYTNEKMSHIAERLKLAPLRDEHKTAISNIVGLSKLGREQSFFALIRFCEEQPRILDDPLIRGELLSLTRTLVSKGVVLAQGLNPIVSRVLLSCLQADVRALGTMPDWWEVKLQVVADLVDAGVLPGDEVLDVLHPWESAATGCLAAGPESVHWRYETEEAKRIANAVLGNVGHIRRHASEGHLTADDSIVRGPAKG
jgi:hypothetical protein